MKYFFIALILFSCSAGSREQGDNQVKDNNITISGTVGYPQEGNIILEKIEDNQAIPYDTFQLNDDNSFNEEVTIEDHGYFRLNFYDKQYVMLILEDDDVKVDVDGNSRNGFVKISGSDAHAVINKVQGVQQQFQQSQKFKDISADFNKAAKERDAEEMENLQQEYVALEDKLNQDIISIMDSAGMTLGVVDLLASGRVLDKDRYFDFYVRKSEEFKEAMPGNTRVETLVDQVQKLKVTAIGAEAPEISLPNPEGDTIKLSSLRGNYVLVDFWAKWCRPCRMENPNIVRMYNKYKDENFEVYGVSLDRNKRDWVQAIEEDKLDWTQVSDLKYWNSRAAKKYGVSAIPFAVLLDPEGRIIAKNLRGKQLENKLEEIFGG